MELCTFIIYIWYLEVRYVYEFWNVSIYYRCVWLVNSHNKRYSEHFLERQRTFLDVYLLFSDIIVKSRANIQMVLYLYWAVSLTSQYRIKFVFYETFWVGSWQRAMWRTGWNHQDDSQPGLSKDTMNMSDVHGHYQIQSSLVISNAKGHLKLL